MEGCVRKETGLLSIRTMLCGGVGVGQKGAFE